MSGHIKSKIDVPLVGASILLLGHDSIRVISYSSSDQNGNYQLLIPADAFSESDLIIKVQLLGYESQTVRFVKGQNNYDFSLTEVVIALKDVVIKSGIPKVKSSGDTTSFIVKDFAAKEDRTIGDVLRRIPGITVEDNGLIKFNGKSIKRLYLDGDDLLSDKYNLGTRTIPQNLVDEVQVLENHQAINALKDKIFSEDVDINLTFKPQAALKVFGEIQAGAGYPQLYDDEATALSLKKNYKAISELKLENTGDLLSDNVASLNEQETQKNQGFTPEGRQLSVGTGSSPALDGNRYLFNNSGLLSTANLWKLPSGMQIKSKVYYQDDRIHQSYNDKTFLYLPSDTIAYSELQNKTTENQKLYADAIIELNRSDIYLNDALNVAYDHENDIAYLISNGQPINQTYGSNLLNISNELKFIKSPKGRIFTEFYSFMDYRRGLEKLSIDSLNLVAIFSNPSNLNIVQRLNIPTFFSNNYFSFNYASGQIVQSYKAGIVTEVRSFDSQLTGLDYSGRATVPDSATNALKWTQIKPYIEPNYEWHNDNNLHFTAKLPINYQYSDIKTGTSKAYNDVLFNPDVAFRYDPDRGLAVKTFYERTMQAGDLLQSYPGIVLNDYRSFTQNDQLFSRISTDNLGLLMTYKDPARIFFANLSGDYFINTSNYISFATINRSLSFNDYRLFHNVNRTTSLRGAISKYFYPINTTLNLSYNIQSGQTNQIVNNAVFPFRSLQQSLNIRATGTVTNWFRYEYNLKYLSGFNKPEEKTVNEGAFNTESLSNNLALIISLPHNISLKATSSNQYNKNNTGLNVDYNFLDLSAKFRLIKWKTDFEIQGTNLTNVTTYRSATLSTYSQYTYQYPLRGRMVWLKGTFLF